MKGKKPKILLMVIFISFAFLVSLISTAEDSVIMVPSDYPSIQLAIDAANYGDTVYVSAGTYSPSKNGEIFPIYMKNGVSLVGEGADICILDAEQTSKVIVCNYINDNSTKIEGFTITNASGTLGGGIYCLFSSPTIMNNIITENSARKGGGIYCIFFSSPIIINNVITENSASREGGGIYCEFLSSPTIKNDTITGNSASEGGGGICALFFSYPTITNDIITGNISTSGGGGIHSSYLSSSYITYNDVWENAPQDYLGCEAGTGCISEDPQFVDPILANYKLRAGSPCIDAGDTDASNIEGSGLPEFDFEGYPRIVDGDGDGFAVVDMGAFENQGVTDATIDIDPDTLNLESKGRWITAYIELPADYNVADIDVSTLLLNGSVRAESKPASIGDEDNDGIVDLMAKFDRAAVEALLEVGENVEITVSGSLTYGTEFAGIDIIRVIRKGKGKK